MAILRDILARFAVSVDVSPLNETDRKIEKLKANMRRMAGIATAAFSATAYAAYKFVDAASHADEVINGLNATFKDNSAQVMNWSKTTAKALGRSEFALQEYALRFGAFLSPQFAGTGRDFTEMSTRLSELALDLASFYDTSEEEAMMRLFSGMSGETEAVRRLGIDISDTSLEAFNKKENNDPRTMRALSLQEKTLLRYQKILIDTQDKQGDILRSNKRWADTLKRVQGRLQDIFVLMGRKIMPVALEMLKTVEQWIIKATAAIDMLVNRTSALEAALATAALYAGYLAAEMLVIAGAEITSNAMRFVAYMGEFAALATKIAGIALAFLVIEDVMTFFKGGESVFGNWAKDISGMEEPLQQVKNLWAGIKDDVINAGAVLKEMGRWAVSFFKLTYGAVGLVQAAFWGDMNGNKGNEAVKAYLDSIDLSFNPNLQGKGGALQAAAEYYSGGGGKSTRSAGESESRAALLRGDQAGYVAALAAEQGIGEAEAKRMFATDRATALDQGLIVPTEADITSGLYAPGSVSAPYSGGYSAMSSAPPVQINMTVNPSSGLDEKQVADIASQQVMSQVQQLWSGGAEEAYSSPDGN